MFCRIFRVKLKLLFKRTVHFFFEIPQMLEYARMHCPIERLTLGVFGGPKGLESTFSSRGFFASFG